MVGKALSFLAAEQEVQMPLVAELWIAQSDQMPLGQQQGESHLLTQVHPSGWVWSRLYNVEWVPQQLDLPDRKTSRHRVGSQGMIVSNENK